MLVFTDYVPSPEQRYEFGAYFLYILYIDMALNLILLFFEIAKKIVRNVKRLLWHRKLRKERKLRVQQAEQEGKIKMPLVI